MGFFGLFEDTTVVNVSSAAMNLISSPPNPLKESAFYALLQGTNMIEGIMADSANDMSSKANKAYKYGYNSYTLGLPEGQMGGVVQSDVATVQGIIADELSQDVAIIYAFTDALSAEMAAMEYLRTTRGYKMSTRVISVHPFTLAYANSQPLLLQSVSYIPSTNQLSIVYRHAYQGPLIHNYEEFTETIAKPDGLYLGDTYCVAAYNLLDTEGALLPDEYYWFYRLSTGVYPILSVPLVGFDTKAYFPIVPIRKDNVDLASDNHKGTELYATSKKLLSILSLDIDLIASTLNENPNVADIDHAYVMFGVDIQTKHPASMHYLCEYFDYLADASTYTGVDFHASVESDTIPVKNLLQTSVSRSLDNIEPVDISLLEYGLDIKLRYNYITSTLVTGTIGKVGTVTSSTVIQKLNSGIGWGKNDNSYIRFRMQIEPRVYKEVTVYGLVHLNTIQGNIVATYLSTSLDSDNTSLVIPVHYGVANNIPIMKRNLLYYNSCRLILNSYSETTIPWYASGIFKFVILIIAVVIACYTQQWQLPAGLIAAAAAGASALMLYLLPILLIAIAVGVGTRLLANAIGGKAALILGVVITVIALCYGYYNSTALEGVEATSSMLPTAQQFLQVSSSLMSAGNAEIQTEIMDVYTDTEVFEADAKKQWDILEEATKLLYTEFISDPMRMISSVPSYKGIPNETPDAFYERTIHTGNIGVLALDAIENYAEIMLKLPEVKYN